MPETREKLEAERFVPFYNNPEKTAELLNAHIARVGKIVKDGNVRVD